MNLKDIKLYYNTEKYNMSRLVDAHERNIEVSELMSTTNLDDHVVGYLNTLANKVVKYLLTTKGSDAFNPDYGAHTASRTWIHQGHQVRYRLELNNDLRACAEYIKRSETSGPDNEKLSMVKLVQLEYLPSERPLDIHIYIEIITTLGNRAVLSFNKHHQN